MAQATFSLAFDQIHLVSRPLQLHHACVPERSAHGAAPFMSPPGLTPKLALKARWKAE